eukprot:TRINITY_DN3969_c0_g3_i1.p1 TRINITY_DN3969_c0_g3~~TRINITY_DN3969_c0_g3_i1.p1  ORF type:complete len:321 (+),score=42.45 TRINITY_DN3969_c0_g3_i1:294-1256(+)
MAIYFKSKDPLPNVEETVFLEHGFDLKEAKKRAKAKLTPIREVYNKNLDLSHLSVYFGTPEETQDPKNCDYSVLIHGMSSQYNSIFEGRSNQTGGKLIRGNQKEKKKLKHINLNSERNKSQAKRPQSKLNPPKNNTKTLNNTLTPSDFHSFNEIVNKINDTSADPPTFIPQIFHTQTSNEKALRPRHREIFQQRESPDSDSKLPTLTPVQPRLQPLPNLSSLIRDESLGIEKLNTTQEIECSHLDLQKLRQKSSRIQSHIKNHFYKRFGNPPSPQKKAAHDLKIKPIETSRAPLNFSKILNEDESNPFLYEELYAITITK